MAVLAAALAAARFGAAWLSPRVRQRALLLALAAAVGVGAGWVARGWTLGDAPEVIAAGGERYRADILDAREEAESFRAQADRHLLRAGELERLLEEKLALPPFPEAPPARTRASTPAPDASGAAAAVAPEIRPAAVESLQVARVELARARLDLDALRGYAGALERRMAVQERREAALREALSELHGARRAEAAARGAAERRADLAEQRVTQFEKAAWTRLPFGIGPSCVRSLGAGAGNGWQCGIGVTFDLGRTARLLF